MSNSIAEPTHGHVSRRDMIKLAGGLAGLTILGSQTGCLPPPGKEKVPEKKENIPQYVARNRFFEWPAENFGSEEIAVYYGALQDMYKDFKADRLAKIDPLAAIYFPEVTNEVWDKNSIDFFTKFLNARNAVVQLADEKHKIGIFGRPYTEVDKKAYKEISAALTLAEADFASMGSLIWAMTYQYKNNPDMFFAEHLDSSAGLFIDKSLYSDPILRPVIEKYGAMWAESSARCSISELKESISIETQSPPADLHPSVTAELYQHKFPFFISRLLDTGFAGLNNIVYKSNLGRTDSSIEIDPVVQRPRVFSLELTPDLKAPELVSERQEILAEMQKVIDIIFKEEGFDRLFSKLTIDGTVNNSSAGGREITISGNSTKDIPWWYSDILHETGHAFQEAIMNLPDIERYKVLGKLNLLMTEFDITRSATTLFGMSKTARYNRNEEGKMILDRSSESSYPLWYYGRDRVNAVFSMKKRFIEPLSRLYSATQAELSDEELQLIRFLPPEDICNSFSQDGVGLKSAVAAFGINILSSPAATPFELYIGNRVNEVLKSFKDDDFFQVYKDSSLRDILASVILPYIVQQAIEIDIQGVIDSLKDPRMKSTAVPARLQDWDSLISVVVTKASALVAVKQSFLEDIQGWDSYRHELFAEVFSAALNMKRTEYFEISDEDVKNFLERFNTFVQETKEILVNNKLAVDVVLKVV